MRSRVLKIVFIALLVSPLLLAWLPDSCVPSFEMAHDKKNVQEKQFDENNNPLFEEDGVTQLTITKAVVEKVYVVSHYFGITVKSEVQPSTEVKGNKIVSESMDKVEKRTLKKVEKLNSFYLNLFGSFRELSITLITTLAFALIISYLLGYISVLSMAAGRSFSNVLNAIESVPSILIALFCYAPVSGALARNAGSTSAWLSLFVFVIAATATVLPEAVRSISIPLSDLYNRKYSVSFRSYGFTKNRILSVLMKTGIMKDTLKRVAAGILVKTLVLDTSFGYVVQVGLGSTGTPAHTSPGALIAAKRQEILGTLSADRSPETFWIPALILIAISVAFLIVLSDKKEEA